MPLHKTTIYSRLFPYKDLGLYIAITSCNTLLKIKETMKTTLVVWLSGVVVNAPGIRARCPGFESRGVAPLFHWVATLGKLFTHIASPVSQLQETRVQK